MAAVSALSDTRVAAVVFSPTNIVLTQTPLTHPPASRNRTNIRESYWDRSFQLFSVHGVPSQFRIIENVQSQIPAAMIMAGV